MSQVAKRGKCKLKGSDTPKEASPPTALLVAEEYDERFQPLTENVPISLLPLGNVPLLHISLSRLLCDGFKNIVVYACNHASEIEQFINEHHYVDRFPGVKIKVYDGYGRKCLGDVMRDVECNQLLEGIEEFICAPADLVSEVPLMPFLTNYQDRRKNCSSSALDVVVTKPPPFFSTDDERMYLLHTSDSMKLVQLSRFTQDEAFIFTPESVLTPMKGRESLFIRADVIDTRVLVCSHHVPPLFQDDFDCDTIDDLISEMLNHEEVIGFNINVQFAPASKVVLPVAPCLQHLLRVTPHFLTRLGSTFIHPPNHLIFEPYARIREGIQHTISSGHPLAITPTCFVARTAKINPTSRLIGSCLIGENCTIGPGVVLEDTVLGDNCSIGANSRLSASVLLPNSRVSFNVTVDKSWVCSNVCIHEKVCLGPWCFVGEPGEDDCENLHKGYLCIETEPDLVFQPKSVIVPSENGDSRKWVVLQRLKIQSREESFMSEDDDEDDEKSNVGEVRLWQTNWEKKRRSSRYELSVSRTDQEGDRHEDQTEQVDPNSAISDEILIRELQNNLLRALEEKYDNDIVTLESNSIKHAYDVSLEDMAFLFVSALLRISCMDLKTGVCSTDATTVAKYFKSHLKHFAPVLSKYVPSGSDSERTCLDALEDYCCSNEVVLAAAQWLVHGLYDEDIVSEDTIRSWAVDSVMLSDEETAVNAKRMRENIKPFMDWLDEDDEDDS